MTEAVGYSHLSPAVPALAFLAMVSMVLLIPAFWKTRIVALVALVGWLFVANLINFIGMIHWRGHANDAPVLASILSILRRSVGCGYSMAMACFAHFAWLRLQPLPFRQLSDTRRKNNVIHVFLTLVLPLLWPSLFLLSCPVRYALIEDFGPLVRIRQDLPGFVIGSSPQILGSVTVGIFGVLTLLNYWRMKREDIDSDILGPHSSVRTRKLLLMVVINMPLAMYGVYGQIANGMTFEWVAPTPLSENIASLQIVFVSARSDVDADPLITGAAKTAISMELLAFYVFAWFGLGAEARTAYGEALLKLGRLVRVTHRKHWPHPSTPPFSWSTIALWKANLERHLVNALFLIQPNSRQITPYISTVPPNNSLQVPLTPTRIPPSNPVGDRTGPKRQGKAPSREPAHRQSIHKPPLLASDLANAIPSRQPARRQSIHKPPLTASDRANAIPSVPDIPLRRLSHHKPPLVPLASPNAPAGATPGASGSSPPREEVANNIRRQEKFAPPPRPRRLSYHKPALPSNANDAMPNGMGPTIPPAEILTDIIGERDAVLQGFVPLAPSNPPAMATPGASGSTPPREEAANNIRRQEKFAPRPRPRRLSYHKPAFAPLASNGAMPNPMEPTIPPEEIPMDIISERNALLLQAESVVEASVVQPPPSSISTPTAPPFSTRPTTPLVEEGNAVFQAESVMESTVALSSPSTSTSTAPPPFSTLPPAATPAPSYQQVERTP